MPEMNKAYAITLLPSNRSERTCLSETTPSPLFAETTISAGN